MVLERLLELDADQFEVLVTELLTALGFEAERTGRTRDGGVDIEGRLDIQGLARSDLKVQAKRYRTGNTVDHRAVKEFRASVPEKAQGRSSRRAGTRSPPARRRRRRASRGLG